MSMRHGPWTRQRTPAARRTSIARRKMLMQDELQAETRRGTSDAFDAATIASGEQP